MLFKPFILYKLLRILISIEFEHDTEKKTSTKHSVG